MRTANRRCLTSWCAEIAEILTAVMNGGKKDGGRANSKQQKTKVSAAVKKGGRKTAAAEDDEYQVVVASSNKKRKSLGTTEANDEEEAPPSTRARPKRAAAASNFKEKACDIEAQYVTPKAEKMSMLEQEALVLTSQEKDEARVLIDFSLHDEDGGPLLFEVVGSQDVYITGLMLPKNSNLDKEKAILCEGMGPILEWGIEGYDEGEPVVSISTSLADYVCLKPTAKYKKYFNLLYEKAVVCVEVYRALSPSTGGEPDLGMNDLYARVARSLRSGKHASFSQFFTRDYLIEQGGFIAGQLKALDADAQDKDQLFSGLPAIEALENDCAKRTASVPSEVFGRPGTLKIQEPGSGNRSNGSQSERVEPDNCDADEKLARHLQEIENRNLASRYGEFTQKFAVATGSFSFVVILLLDHMVTVCLSTCYDANIWAADKLRCNQPENGKSTLRSMRMRLPLTTPYLPSTKLRRRKQMNISYLTMIMLIWRQRNSPGECFMTGRSTILTPDWFLWSYSLCLQVLHLTKSRGADFPLSSFLCVVRKEALSSCHHKSSIFSSE